MGTSQKLQPISASDARAEKLERFCQLNIWKQSVQKRLDEEEALKKEIRSWYENDPPEKPIVVLTASGQVELSAKGEQRYITHLGIVALYKHLCGLKGFGLKGFLELCREYLPLKVVDEHLENIPEQKRGIILGLDRTASRRVKAVAKSPLAA
ncbi:MAG: hypothetical protein KGL39_33050 [Patescibacteria group bacterium]|nr:hypothetical protein [Patescibacteria group bacterium]